MWKKNDLDISIFVPFKTGAKKASKKRGMGWLTRFLQNG
jgi:hypothetical protein